MDDSGVSSKPAPVVVGNVGAKYTEDAGVATTTVIESTSDSRILLCYMPVMVYIEPKHLIILLLLTQKWYLKYANQNILRTIRSGQTSMHNTTRIQQQ